MRISIVVAFFIGLLCVGCGRQQSTAKLVPQDRTVSIGPDTLFTAGQQWLYQFAASGKTCVIVGDSVTFVKRDGDHIIVRLDANLSINVPTTGKHRVILVDQKGFHDVPVSPEFSSDKKALIQAVLKEHQERGSHNKEGLDGRHAPPSQP